MAATGSPQVAAPHANCSSSATSPDCKHFDASATAASYDLPRPEREPLLARGGDVPTNEQATPGGQIYQDWYAQRVQVVDAEYQKAMEISAKLMEDLPPGPGEYHDGVPLSASAMKSYERHLQSLDDADWHHSAYREAEIADAAK